MPNTPLPAADMQTYLINLDLTRVALCNAGANTRADILLTKRKETNQMPNFSTFEEVSKSLTPDALALITKHVEDTVALAIANKDEEIGTLNKSVTELTEENAALKKAAAPATTPESILKGVSPEVQALFKKQQEVLDALVAKDQEALATARFEAVKAIPCEEALLKSVLKSASPEAYNVLRAAAEAITKSVINEPAGSDADGEITKSADATYGRLEEAAKSIASAEGISFETAFTKACAANPDLYAAYSKGV